MAKQECIQEIRIHFNSSNYNDDDDNDKIIIVY